YVTDTIRKSNLTLNLGFRFDHMTSVNESSHIPGVPGFEQFVGPLDFAGNKGPTFNNVAPRVGGTYDVTGDGKTVIRGNYARYYDAYNPAYTTFSNPTYVYNGALFGYTNLNGDREITANELTTPPIYYGGLSGPIFDVNDFEAHK